MNNPIPFFSMTPSNGFSPLAALSNGFSPQHSNGNSPQHSNGNSPKRNHNEKTEVDVGDGDYEEGEVKHLSSSNIRNQKIRGPTPHIQYAAFYSIFPLRELMCWASLGLA